MADHPDVYADGVAITVNEIETIVTRNDPAIAGLSEQQRVIVARVRMARPVAQGVRDTLHAALTQQGKKPKTVLQ